jgi:sulfonate transport system ATP-binding protein
MGFETRGTHLVIDGLSKSFGDHAVLKGIDLEVLPGEFVAIVGRSGCGKSTLLRLIAGLDSQTSGSIYLDGKRSHRLNSTARMMFQDARLLPWEKVLPNVELGLFGAHGNTHRKALHLLQEVGLRERARDWPAVLSGGQRQRVSLARALVSEPPLLLLDEPLGALDALTRIEMQNLMETLWQEQRFTSLLITHDVEEAVVLADRVVLIENGQVGLDYRVDLPRPRERGNSIFAQTVDKILQRVMNGQESAQEALALAHS